MTLPTDITSAPPNYTAAAHATHHNTAHGVLNALNGTYEPGSYATVAALVASTRASTGVGTTWTAGRYRYTEAASGAVDHHLTTAGGVKLYVQPKNGMVEIDAWGVDATTTSITTQLTQAAAIADRIVLSAITYKVATRPTIDADVIGKFTGSGTGAVINLTMASGAGWEMASGRRLSGVKFTSAFTGPTSAADNHDAAGGGNYDYGARSVTLNQDCHIEDVEIEYASAGIHVTGPRVTGRRLHIHDIRQYKGWGSALHFDTTSTIYGHFTDLFFENCDRGIEVESGASYNLFERGLLQTIGPPGYTGQPGDYADYTFVLDVHSHSGEGSCQGNTYRDFRLYNCRGGITSLRSSGSTDSDHPRGNVWENILIEGRVGTTGYQTVYVQGHGNKVRNLRLLLGGGVTSMMNVLFDNGSSTNNEVEITEATGYALPLVKIGTSSAGRGNRVKLSRIFDATSGSDWLVDVNHPDSTVELDVQNVTNSVGYCRLTSTAAYSKISGYYSVLTGTAMTQTLRVAGALNAEIDVVGVAGATGVLDVYATNSTVGLLVNAVVDRASGAAVNFDSTTSGCKITPGSIFGGGSVVNAGTSDNTRGGASLPVSPAGRFMALSGASVGTAAFSNSALRLVPYYLGASITIDQIAGEVTVIGDVGRAVADMVTNATTTITSATAAFVTTDQGRSVTGTNIPAGTYIASVTNGTTAVLTAAATGSGSGGSLTISGAVVRLGIYNDAGGLPGTALVDKTIPGETVAVAVATVSPSVTLQPGWYWVGGAVQGVTTTAPTVRTTSGASPNIPIYGSTAANVMQSAQAGQTKSGVTVALPSFGTTPSAVTTAPRVAVRLA